MNDRMGEIHGLADRYCAGLLTAAETQQLNDRLRDDTHAQRDFLEASSLNARLQWEFAALHVGELSLNEECKPSTTRFGGLLGQRVVRPAIAVSILSSAVAVVACAVFLLRPAAATGDTVARLKGSVDAAWAPGLAPARDLSLRAGRLRLEQGLAEIEFLGGATAVVKGPADITLVTADQAVLRSGQVVVRVPHDQRGPGFQLLTPTARLLDLGTEFAVEIGDDGKALLQVYEGEVQATMQDDTSATIEQRVEGGQAIWLDGTRRERPFWPERFVRVLPNKDDPAGRGVIPYNRSRHDQVHIFPATGPVTIDGDLSDWDLSGRFFAACEAPYDTHHYLEASMMYDAGNLYVGAHVGDPFPMRSHVSPYLERESYGMGGGIALRVSTDRQAGWPLRAEHEDARNGRPATADDLNDKLSFIVLWYYRPEQKACLHLRHGMDLHGVRVNPPGYSGAFVEDADGLGYTLEYALPWSLLNAGEDPPRAGDELAAMWLVHWSAPDGRVWKGQLIEGMNPREQGWNFLRAATWGKATYHGARHLPSGVGLPND